MPKLMQEIEQVIGSAKLQAEHPELFHYTKPDILRPIVEKNTIWATHFKDLSDTEEIGVLKEPLVVELERLFDEVAAGRGRAIKRKFAHFGGAKPQARKFVDSIYKATFEIGNPDRAVDAFTTSFSTHSADGDYERENGLEGQWESYGKDGFCLVFDTAEMCKILLAEHQTHDWTHLKLDPVRYLVPDVPLREHFPELVTAATRSIHQFFNSVKNPEMAITQFLEGATLLKKAKYLAEREVRIVAIPGAPGYQKQAKIENRGHVPKPLPAIKLRPDKSGRRYVNVFEGCNVMLPIKRVIVGPSRDQAAHAQLARDLVGSDRVTVSQPR
jgi:hypothetical protein